MAVPSEIIDQLSCPSMTANPGDINGKPKLHASVRITNSQVLDRVPRSSRTGLDHLRTVGFLNVRAGWERV